MSDSGGPHAPREDHPSGSMIPPENETWILHVFIHGNTPAAAQTVENLERICEGHLDPRFEIRIVDIADSPEAAVEMNIYAVPTVVRYSPKPVKKVIGDLSDTRMTLAGLEIPHGRS